MPCSLRSTFAADSLGCLILFNLISTSGVSCQDPLAHLYEQQENLDTGALAGFGQQVVLNNKVEMRLKVYLNAYWPANKRAILFVCFCSSPISLTTQSGFPTTVTLPAHPCPHTSVWRLRTPATGASLPVNLTG